MAQKYERIILVRPDIFEAGGDGVFRYLSEKGGKNLVVLDQDVLRRLGATEHSSLGGRAALDYLDEYVQFPEGEGRGSSRTERARTGASRSANIRHGHVDDNLDVALIRGAGDKDLPGLVAKVGREYSTSDGSPPRVMTNNRSERIALKADRIAVEKPGFLMVNSGIVDEWAVTGNEELLAKLRESNYNLPLERAVEVLNQDLRLNQFVRFVSSSPDFARVEGDLQWDRDRNEIRGVSNLRLRLLDDREKSRKLKIGEAVLPNLLGVTPLDMSQYLALQYGLLNPDISTFFLCGSHGSGKTLLAYAAAIEQVLWYDKGERQRRGYPDADGKGGRYERIVLLKPNQTLGGKKRDVGALPGTLWDKLRDHLSSYIDAHRETDLYTQMPFEDLMRHPKLPTSLFDASRTTGDLHLNGVKARLSPRTEAMEMTYSGVMYGRSFRNTLVIVDEAQNFEPYELRVIIERLGLGCKVVIMGDPWQANGEHVDREINGLTSAMAHYVNTPFTGMLTLGRNYRSQASRHARDWRTF
ncbi:PhoH family protein [Candidatus Woesearchaeota archaeon]|nr:PhoH family protein [Candidatus Woesearchaeota archaeon]